MNKKSNGFTVIEAIIVLLMISLLAFGYIYYRNHNNTFMQRVDARNSLLKLASEMETYRGKCHSFPSFLTGSSVNFDVSANDKGCVLDSTNLSKIVFNSVSNHGFYTLSIIQASSTSFILQAAPSSEQINKKCKIYRINEDGIESVGQIFTLSFIEDPEMRDACWNP